MFDSHTDLAGSAESERNNLEDQLCNTAEELMAMMDRGNDQRTVAATAMNSESSRSHLVLLIKIISVNKETKETLKGKMLMCDLAGSERLKKSEVTEHQQKEAIEINRSLTALGDVIEALTKGGKGVVPYRNHKLTQLMQDSLGGTAKTLMFVNCSPASSNLDETFMSLKYAQRAKKITNTATKSK
ncbi:KIN14E [Symbiodinium microadriaticum]|nr:KIN14E [Symbiodinium microadriaticum]